ncbi:endonuclease domain-containing protein [Microbacterium sp. B19]|uniref:endonuclease domain-containing protein n=1 Tax=Microbacterium sp. B19 TaxID=96765 RepID=UPI0011D21B0F|nr:hypothetical protein [Microbacterium sp. B19]
MHPRPLPEPLDASFHVQDADRLGVPRRRLVATDVWAPFHAVRARVGTPSVDTLDRCRLYAPRLRDGQVFSHETAAELWGMPLPRRPASTTLHVSAAPPLREPRTTGVTAHRIGRDAEDLTTFEGLPVTTPVATWVHLSGSLSEPALVAMGDWLLAHGIPKAALEAAVARSTGRGVVALRRAFDRLRLGVESPRETAVRLVLVDAGLPEPTVNWTLRTKGRFVARLDMSYRDYRVAVEYDGRQHALEEQFRRDADRWRAITDAGWILVRVLSHHLDSPARDIVAPVRRALESRGWSA